MTKYIVHGGHPLKGEVSISGAKNAILPVLSATIINNGISTITNCPEISDVKVTAEILQDLGCKVKITKSNQGNKIEIDATQVNKTIIDTQKASRCRSTITFLGALTARLKEAEVAYPGGCVIGDRPIDIHESIMNQMGIKAFHIRKDGQYIRTELSQSNTTGTEKNVYLKFPSVGATENALMAAAGLEEQVNIYGAATEPEIVCLGNYLQKIGVQIKGLGTSHIKIMGKKTYNNNEVTFKIIPDRIEAATYMIIAAATGESINIHGMDYSHCKEIIKMLKNMGCSVKEYNYSRNGKEQSVIEISQGALYKSLKTPGVIIADAFPSFPTDAQSLTLPLLATTKGETYVIDKIFPKRFKAAEELQKAGAKIQFTDFGIKITGRKHLKGTLLNSYDLRGGAAMIIAGLISQGQTIISDPDYIKRGYEKMPEKLRALGANIIVSTENH